jgi:AAA family ATP:ADP antiporter
MTTSALHFAAADPNVRTDPTALSRFSRLADVRAGEAACAALFFAYAFVLLVCYYQLRLVREPLLLADGSAELKSYAQAAMAVVLMVLVPVYAAVFKRVSPLELVRTITAFFVANLAVFYLLGTAGFDIGFAFYVWVGVFNVTMIAQFWAHAAHTFDVASGQRLFPIVMAGATLGGLAGAALARSLFPLLGTWNLLLLAAALLAATVPLVKITSRAVPSPSRNRHVDGSEAWRAASHNGFALLLHDRYLVLLAALIVMLNCVSATGDYLLAELVLRDADLRIAADAALDRGALIGAFYGDFNFTFNALTVVLQVLLVGRVFRRVGVHGAILVLPIVALLGYGLLAALPALAVVHFVKTAENGINYSLMNTARHALFLPLPTAHQFQGKTAIDGFFWRVGDLTQAVIVYAGLNWLGFAFEHFAALNALLAALWIALTLRVARHYRRRTTIELRAARPRRAGRLAAAGLGLAVAGAALTAAAELAASEAALFSTQAPLELELRLDKAGFCRNPGREGCEDARGTLLYHGAGGSVPIEVKVRSRGRWREDTGDCPLPALFVFFDGHTAAGTPFAGQTMLPLTTHCRSRTSYEQYVLKEYLAYRIYNELTDKSLRVRLATITYRDVANPKNDTTRFGFFTEHFDSLAARHAAEVWRVDEVDVARVEPQELATLALFQYLIGNTDWSAVYGHNTVALRDAAGTVSVVPYDFDFSGLVDAEYAGPPPGLPINSVRERVFRGFCTPTPDWDLLFDHFGARRAVVFDRVAEVPELLPAVRKRVLQYLGSFFDQLESPQRRASIAAVCRRG